MNSTQFDISLPPILDSSVAELQGWWSKLQAAPENCTFNRLFTVFLFSVKRKNENMVSWQAQTSLCDFTKGWFSKLSLFSLN